MVTKGIITRATTFSMQRKWPPLFTYNGGLMEYNLKIHKVYDLIIWLVGDIYISYIQY